MKTGSSQHSRLILRSGIEGTGPMLRMARSHHNSPDSFQSNQNSFLSSYFRSHSELSSSGVSQIEAGLARLSAEVRTALPHLSASSEAAQKQLCREVELLQSEVSGLQALAADRVWQRDVEAMCQEAEAGLAALRSEVGQLRKTADAAERAAENAQQARAPPQARAPRLDSHDSGFLVQ
jgi:chromosome segregation ATPase